MNWREGKIYSERRSYYRGINWMIVCWGVGLFRLSNAYLSRSLFITVAKSFAITKQHDLINMEFALEFWSLLSNLNFCRVSGLLRTNMSILVAGVRLNETRNTNKALVMIFTKNKNSQMMMMMMMMMTSHSGLWVSWNSRQKRVQMPSKQCLNFTKWCEMRIRFPTKCRVQ